MEVTADFTEPWRPYPHAILLNQALMDVAAGRIKRLTVSMPPQHGKSELISKFFPAWYLGTYPSRRIIQTMYEANLAATFGGMARDILTKHGIEQFGVTVDPGSQAKAHWNIWDPNRKEATGGGMNTAGARGPITGKGCNILIIDDPIKGIDDALSPLLREKTWEWFQAVARSRLRKGAAIILVQTRWHYEDLAGKVLKRMKEGGEVWTEINLPALYDVGDDLLGRKQGEALCEQLHPAEELEATRDTTDPYWWNALYQGRPSPREGGIVNRDWWEFWDELPDRFDDVICSWDMSFERVGDKRTSHKGPDFVVGQVWGRLGASFYLLSEVREKLSFSETINAVRRLKADWPMASAVLVELKAAGPAVVWALQDEIPGIMGVKPLGSKEVRVHAITPLIRAGQVLLPETGHGDAHWVAEWIEEWAQFPQGPYDDRVDAGSQALDYLKQQTGVDNWSPVANSRPSTWKD